MKKEMFAKCIKTILDCVVISEEREHDTVIMYHPTKPESIKNDSKKKNNKYNC